MFVWRRFNFHVIETDWHSLEHRAVQVITVAVLMATVEILACRLGIEGAEFGGERVAPPRIGGSAIAGSAHQISQHIRRAQHRFQDIARSCKPSRT